MKQILTCIPFLLIGITFQNSISLKKQVAQEEKKFKLRFVTVGFGSNMFEMEPIFNVDGNQFVYTSEEVWISSDRTKIERDTLLTGYFRTSSIDSISNLISTIKDSVIYKTNNHVMSGSAGYIKISNSRQQISFQLHNTSDTTADKIVSILNSYIPKECGKLFISDYKRH